MSTKYASATVVIVALLIVSAFGSFVYFFRPSIHVGIPHAKHQQIVDSMDIIMTDYAFEMMCVCVESKPLTWGGGFAVATFKQGETYDYSMWHWTYYDDAMYTMKIWGPDESGKKYSVQIARHHHARVKVLVNDEIVIDVDKMTNRKVTNHDAWIWTDSMIHFEVTIEHGQVIPP